MHGNTISNRDYLYFLFLEAKSIPDETLVNDIIYIGQKAKIFNSTYKFKISSASVADPYSLEMMRDLYFFIEYGYIKNTNSFDSLTLADQTYNINGEPNHKKGLQELLNIDRNDLKTLGRILILEENFTSKGLNDTNQRTENIAQRTWTSVDNVKIGLEFVNYLHSL